MITDEFRAAVRHLRDLGKSWPEVSRTLQRPQRTCQRAVEEPDRLCAHRGCTLHALTSGVYCATHAKQRMRNKPGRGERQTEVMRLMRKHGHLTSEELRGLTGIDSSNLGQITKRLVQLGLLDRPLRGHFTMPRPDNLKPQHPVVNTPDRY